MKRPDRTPMAFFLRRKSHVDDSRFFNHEDRRVYFDKACWAQWIMPNLDADQEPAIVNGPVLDDDMSYQEWLVKVGLVGTQVTPAQYLIAIEQTMRDAKTNKQLTGRQARQFQKWFKQQRRKDRRGR